MWLKKKPAPILALLLLLAMGLGFWGGYYILPQTGLTKALLLQRPLLAGGLPFSAALAAGAPDAGADTAQLSSGLLQASLPSAATLELPAATAADGSQSSFPTKANPRLIVMEEDSITAYAGLSAPAGAAADQPRIAVYCTHSSEEYSDGKRVPGRRGGVHEVARALTDKLNSLGLSAVYCDTVHDYPEWNLSYANSLASIQALKEQYPSLEVFIDVHRDSKADSVLNTSQGQLARMMLVVGSNQRLPHPDWQKNKAFAEQICAALEARVKGSTRGVSVQQGRYNQQISTKAILVEMGSTVNSGAEAVQSAQLLAEVLAQLL